IGYRVFITPIQVASWHFLYVAEHGHPGFSAMPFGAQLTGETKNMPELVYKEYGIIYSGGDSTSTSTAPTGFTLAYPANLGWYGIPVALALLALMDVAFALVVRRLPAAMLGIGGGLAAVLAMNM